MNPSYTIFDRRNVRQHRHRAVPALGEYDFLLREMAARMGDRLRDVKRRFPLALDLGAHTGMLTDYIAEETGIETLVHADMSEAMLRDAPGLRVVADEEWLPFAPESFDLVMSVGSMHWINDLPGALIQINRILKPGGWFLAMLPGGETLKELRQSFEQAEMAVSGGLSPRISPFIDVRDAGSLLQRAGFVMPVTDSEMLTVSYETPLKILQDLRGMGEANALMTRSKGFLRRSVLFAALDHYQKYFSDDHKRVTASFELVTMTGWKADAAGK